MMFNMQLVLVNHVRISDSELCMYTILSTYKYTCLIASCKDGDLKLVGAISENEGRLEVCLDQRWGTINGDGWTHTDTQVACRQLGYSTSGISSSLH